MQWVMVNLILINNNNICIKLYIYIYIGDFIDYLKYPENDDFNNVDENDSSMMKDFYIKIRPKLLDMFNLSYDISISNGTKGRIVVWVIGNLNHKYSSLLLNELPLDISNLCHWKHKFIPAIIRVGIHDDNDDLMNLNIKQFLHVLSFQYFKLHQFNVKDDINELKESLKDQSLNLNEIDKPMDKSDELKFTIKGNPYDIFILVKDINDLYHLLDKIFSLHKHEINYLKTNRSFMIGSGGNLYLVDNKLITSYSPWRRLDWLTMAQTSFMPRLWIMNKKSNLDEFIHLLDYRYWRGRFTHLFENDFDENELNRMIISYPDSKAIDIYLNNDNAQFKRRRRERNWNKIMNDEFDLLLSSFDYQHSQESFASTEGFDEEMFKPYDLNLNERNIYRITVNDLDTLKDLIKYFQRENKYKESLDIIEKEAVKVDTHHEIYKLKGIALLKLEKKEEAKNYLLNYRKAILKKLEDDILLGKHISRYKKAQIYSEYAGVSFIDESYEESQEYSMKALLEFKSIQNAYKTLIWSAIKTGISSNDQEDLIFSFFINELRDIEKAEEYYKLVISKFPNNAFFLFGYAMYLYIKGVYNESYSYFEKALDIDPNNPKFLESFATFLFQTKQFENMDKISSMYRKALQIDSSNVVTKSNMAAFLLYHGEDEEGMMLLEEVLYSLDLFKKNPNIYLESWFYSLCYSKDQNKRFESMKQLKFAIRKGMRTPLWDLSIHSKHFPIQSERGWIEKLAKVIQSELNISVLSKWERWDKTPSNDLMKKSISLIMDQKETKSSDNNNNEKMVEKVKNSFSLHFSRKKNNNSPKLNSEDDKVMGEKRTFSNVVEDDKDDMFKRFKSIDTKELMEKERQKSSIKGVFTRKKT